MITRKTKIVCSIEPACDNDDVIREMIREGMNIARFNFSHGTYEWHKQAMDRVKRISDELNIPVAILLDTKGPEIRTGLVEDDKIIKIKKGSIVKVVADDSFCTASTDEKNCHISISWKDAPEKNHVLKILDSLPQGTNVCHSDLHPSNIIITESGEYRVIDWCDTMCDSPLLDVARTLLIYKSLAPMPGANIEELNKSRAA